MRKISGFGRKGGLLICVLLLALTAQAQLTTDSALGFFTNLSARLLKSELGLNLDRIQIWPTNQYTPAVHRLLQVTANLYDATTNRFNADYPYLPSVFRPVFTNDSGSIYICGFAEENGNAFTNQWRDLSQPAQRAALQRDDCVSGIPLVKGAKKGFPNFNEFAMQSVVQLTRKLQVTKPNFTSYGTRAGWQTNLMFVLGISNAVGCELWNSYRANYARDVDIYIACDVWITLTNGYGLTNSFHETIIRNSQINSNDWVGWASTSPANGPSFVIPLKTNIICLPVSIYRFGSRTFEPNLNGSFENPNVWPGGRWPVPQWGLSVTNRLRCTLVDRATGRLIDFVQFDSLNGIRDLSYELQDPNNTVGFNGLWSTNHIGDGLQQGVHNQLDVSVGNSGGGNTEWNSFGLNQPTGDTKKKEIDKFRVFNGLSPIYFPSMIDTNLVMQVPFTPTKRIYQHVTWQANDPMVHYLPDDMATATNEIRKVNLALDANKMEVTRNIGYLNDRFDPWGGNPAITGGQGGAGFPNAFKLALKDPLIRRSDDWHFTNSLPLAPTTLGRVHRGTPWQTVYLKADDIDDRSWQEWSGNFNAVIARANKPKSDWRLVSLLVSLLNTNSPHQLLSVNERATDPWLAALDGIEVITNLSALSSLALTMTSNSPQAALIADGIRVTRASLPSQTFRTLGDVLAVPELSVKSPWLNTNSSLIVTRGISDEAYEAIPSQLLSRLRPDSFGTITLTNGSARLEFAGFDGYAYAVQSSSNLTDWATISTNWPTNGVFISDPQITDLPAKFYRSVLLP